MIKRQNAVCLPYKHAHIRQHAFETMPTVSPTRCFMARLVEQDHLNRKYNMICSCAFQNAFRGFYELNSIQKHSSTGHKTWDIVQYLRDELFRACSGKALENMNYIVSQMA